LFTDNPLKPILLGRNHHPMSEMAQVDLSSLKTKTVMNEPAAISTLIDSIPALVAYIDCNMILQYCNHPFKKWFAVDDCPGSSFPAIAGEEIFSQIQRHMGKILVGEKAHFQMSVYKGGEIHFLEATLSPDFDAQHKVKGFIFHSADITEKSRTERALKDYFENASIGLHWVNADGIIIWANPAELKMLGYSEADYIGRHISEFHADKNVIQDILTQLLNKQAIRNHEADLLCKDGSIRHVTINSTGLWEQGRFVHTRCFTVDVTEQRRAARAVKESEERFKMMANLIPLIIWTTDARGNCNFLSVRWEEVTGKSVDEGFDDRWINFIHSDDQENIRDSWKKSVSAKKTFEAKFRYLNATGDFQVHYAHSIPRYTSTGDFAGYIGILQDISSEEVIKSSLEKIVLDRTEDLRKRNTELKRAEKELQDKNRELEEINNQLSSFAHIASHDLQEPLRKIQTFSDRLFQIDGHNFSEKGKELYTRMNHSSHRMRALIHDLLAYSKTNGTDETYEVVDLNLVIKDVVNELDVKIAEKKARIENFGLPQLNVIRFQFHQLFLNLVSNAIKFTKEESAPHVVIKSEIVEGSQIPNDSIDTDGKYYHISVTDNGIGFESQYANKIFEMFHRLHGRSQYEGTGIGLAICKKIVMNHHGVITADGALNVGACFHIYLPVQERLVV
jgi:PAS domain S-box-containing protein